MDKYKVGKHFKLTIGEDSFTYERKKDNIDGEASLDGIYVVRTSAKAESMPAPKVVESYKSLSGAERAFRSLKTVDLRVRLIHTACPTGCAPTSCCACWPTTWSGTCEGCCSAPVEVTDLRSNPGSWAAATEMGRSTAPSIGSKPA